MARSSKVKIDSKNIIDIVIAGLIVGNSGTVVNMFAPSLAGGTTGKLAGAGLAYLAGVLMKKPLVANAGIGFSLADVVNDMVAGQLLGGTTPDTTTETQSLTEYARFNNHRLGEYTNNVQLSRDYESYYQN